MRQKVMTLMTMALMFIDTAATLRLVPKVGVNLRGDRVSNRREDSRGREKEPGMIVVVDVFGPTAILQLIS